MSRHGPQGDCGCCNNCEKIVPYISPFIDIGDSSNRFSNWSLTGLNQFNTYAIGSDYGNVYVEATLNIFAFNDYRYAVKIYKTTSTTPSTNLLCQWTLNTTGIIFSQTINLTEQNGSGVSGSVDFDSPFTMDAAYPFVVRGTEDNCDLTVGGSPISNINWQVTAIDDPFQMSGPTGTVTISNTSDIVRTISVALASITDRCFAQGQYATAIGVTPLHAVYTGFPLLEEDIGYGLVFNDFDGSSYGKFNIVLNLANGSGGRAQTPAFTQPGSEYDICFEIPPTVLTNSFGDEVTIRMDHS